MLPGVANPLERESTAGALPFKLEAYESAAGVLPLKLESFTVQSPRQRVAARRDAEEDDEEDEDAKT